MALDRPVAIGTSPVDEVDAMSDESGRFFNNLAEFYEKQYHFLAIGFGLLSTFAVPALASRYSESSAWNNPVHNLAIATGLLLVERSIKISRRMNEQARELRRLQTSDFVDRQVLGSIQDAGILTNKVSAIMNLSSPGQSENQGSQVAVLMLRRFVGELLQQRISVSEGNFEMQLHFKDNSLLAYQCCWDALVQRQSEALLRREFRPKGTIARALHCVDPRVWSTENASKGKAEILSRLFDQQAYFVSELHGQVCRLMVCDIEPGTKRFDKDILPVLSRMRDCGIDVAYICHKQNEDSSIALPPSPKQGFVWVERFRYAQGWRYASDQEGIPIELTEVIWSRRDREVRESWNTWKNIYFRLREAGDSRLYLPDDGVKIV